MNKSVSTALLLLLASLLAYAGDATVWSISSRSDFLKGNAKNISIDDNGTLRVTPTAREVFDTEQPFIWSTAYAPGLGIILGTGGDGKVFRVDDSGKGSLLADFAEINVSALAVNPAGEIFAATSPDGKVYKIGRDGKATVFFEPKEKYIWDLAVFPDGTLAVATGDTGKIYRVRGGVNDWWLLHDSSETHIICLATDAKGNLYAGTDSNGTVLRIGDGMAFSLLDSPLREIHDLRVLPDGTVVALALSESVSTKTETPAASTGAKTVSVEKPHPANPEQPRKSRHDLSGAKSAVHRIDPDGASSVIWNSSSVAAFSLDVDAASRRVLIGTGDNARTYQVELDGSAERLVTQLSQDQVSDILLTPTQLAFATSGQGKLFATTLKSPLETGVYESAVLDAKSSSRWGRVDAASTGAVKIETRSGNTEIPTETWSRWAETKDSQVASPQSRYFQWRATLTGDASVREVNVTFKQTNIAPEVLALEVLPPNVGLAANPGMQIDPNIALSGQEPAAFGIQVVEIPPRKLYQRGARSLQWKAEDRNDDSLVFDVFIKKVGESEFRLLRSGLSENYLTIDGLTLSDGRYVVKVVASDSPSNQPGQELTGRKESDPFDIDNSAPSIALRDDTRSSGPLQVRFDVTDSGSGVMRVEYSVDAGDWRTVNPEDGISDGPKEIYRINLNTSPSKDVAVTVRAFDRNGNVATVTVGISKQKAAVVSSPK
jgi:hypothetical protein